jgi:Secretion system C-terminal sorting domain/FG-GAP-like repeat
VADLNGDGKEELITGSRNGYLKVYKNFTEQNQAKFIADSTNIFDEFTNKNTPLLLGGNLSVAIADLTNDGIPDVMLGTNTGGLKWLKNTSKFIITATEETINQSIYPNPTNRFVYIKNPLIADYEVFDTMGRKVLSQKNQQTNQELVIDLGSQIEGVYFLKILIDGDVKGGLKLVLRK